MLSPVGPHIDHFRGLLISAETGFDGIFRRAREIGADYFLLAGLEQGDRSFRIASTLYLGRTGTALASGSYYRTGNDRVRDAASLAAAALDAALPLQGVLLKRDFTRGLVDLGSAQGITAGMQLAIVKRGTARLLPPTGSLGVGDADRLGTFTVEQVDENASQGRVEVAGYFDRINAGDEVIAAAAPSPPAPSPAPSQGGLLKRLFGIGK